MLIRSLAGLLGLLILIALIAAPAQSPTVAQGDPAGEMFQLINQYRASQGLPPFQYNGLLASAAQSHASWMAANVIYSHTGAGGSSPQTRANAAGYVGYVVENIVGGTSMSARQGLIWWQNSPIHYNTLVTSSYPQAGVGFAGNGDQNMFVLVVGRPPGVNETAPPRANSAPGPLIITPIELAQPREDGSIVHVIRQGQAMWTIAAYYDVDLAYLYLINNLTENDVLHPGDEVTVQLADGQEPPPTPTPPLNHIVREGESAWSIALQHGIDLGFLYLLNNMTEDSMLHPGDEVIVRLAEGQAPPPTPTPRTTHIVREGQSLWLIAALYNLSIEQLMDLNSLTVDSVIRPGDELQVRPPSPTPLPTAPPIKTPTPAISPVAAKAVAAGPSPIALVNPAAASTPDSGAPDPGTPDPGAGSASAALPIVAFAGLVLLAGAIFLISRRQS